VYANKWKECKDKTNDQAQHIFTELVKLSLSRMHFSSSDRVKLTVPDNELFLAHLEMIKLLQLDVTTAVYQKIVLTWVKIVRLRTILQMQRILTTKRATRLLLTPFYDTLQHQSDAIMEFKNIFSENNYFVD
jgi:hypothetical protein